MVEELVAKYGAKAVSYVEMQKDRYDIETDDFTDSDYELHLYCELQLEAEEDIGLSAEAFCEIWSVLEEEDANE